MTTEPKFFSRHEDREGVRPPASVAPTKPMGFLGLLLVICLLPFILIWLLAAAGRAAAKARERDGPKVKKRMGTLEKVAWGAAAIYFLHAFWSDQGGYSATVMLVVVGLQLSWSVDAQAGGRA